MIYIVFILSITLLILEFYKYKRNSVNTLFQETAFFVQYFLIMSMLNSDAFSSFLLKILLSILLVVMLLNNMNATYKSLTIKPKYKILKLLILSVFQIYTVIAIYVIFMR